jgi:aspartyl-tRNA(Asn)/glutamyl-tRNA(Gln) amidotransferase subunit C
MPLSRQQVEHVARLARLNLTPQEIDRYTTELTVILGYIDQLAEVDTSGIAPYNQSHSAESGLREDVVESSLPRPEVLRNAPHHDEEFFLVPRVLGS